MRFGKIALEGRGLDAIDWKNGQKQWMAAERVAIGRHHKAAYFLDAVG